jgi:Ca2+-binding EF-hand superfamily protein
MESSSFPMEKSEYNSVFKVFDKNSTGKIEIGQVMDLIQSLENSAKDTGDYP